MTAPNTPETFWARVIKSPGSGCWVWSGCKTRDGYGRVRYGGRNQRAHRVAYEITVGPIPSGLEIDHTCYNRACVRPEHLRTATRKQNCQNLKGARNTSLSGIRGIKWESGPKRWRGRVRADNVEYSESFPTLEEAQAWVVRTRLELFTHSDADRIAS